MNFLQKIKDFIKNILSKESDISSKRFWGSLVFLSAIVLSYLEILGECEDIPTNKLYLITSMYFFGSICLGLGIFDKFKGGKNV